MGINASNLALMALARREGADFARVATIGRYRLNMSIDELENFFQQRGREDLKARAGELADAYCEKLIKAVFGSEEVQSIDASDYEHADILHDMNTPISTVHSYSVVLDFGTLEHVFNLPVALDNVAQLCAAGGWIMHMLPANNLVGHGFYQFSPELFFQVYAPERGFDSTRIFAVADSDPHAWYEVKAPRDLRARVNITSRDQLHLLILTRKAGAPESLAVKPVQQSDYLAHWGKTKREAPRQKRRGWVSRVIRILSNKLRHRRKIAHRDVAAPARADLARCRPLELAPTL